MYVDEISRQQFSKSRGFQGRMSLTEEGLVLGGTLLAKMGDGGLRIDGEEERLLTLLSVARNGELPAAALSALRRVSKHWRSGDKCLAAIHLAQSGLGKLDSEAAYRVALAAELIDAGIAPRELARELGLNLIPGNITKYWEDEPRVPAGSGRTSGEWTVADASGSVLFEGRSTSVRPRPHGINRVPDLPKDAVPVTTPKGTTIDDPYSKTGNLMAPPRANFRDVYAAGTRTQRLNLVQIDNAIDQFGSFDFQRDKATNTFYAAYTDASNYAVGVFMAGVGYTREQTSYISEQFAYFFSRNYETDKEERQYWTNLGWDDAHDGIWK